MKLKILLLLFTLSTLFNTVIYAQKALRDSLRIVIEHSKPDSNKVNALYDLGFSYVNSSPDSAVFYGMQAMELAKKLNYKAGIANADYVLGAGTFRKGDLKKAATYFQDCETIAKEISNKTLAIKACIGLGNIGWMTANFDAAIEYFQRGVALCEETKDLSRLATLLNNIGNIHSGQLRKREAISYYRKSLEVSHTLKDTGDLALAYSSLANAYKSLYVFDSARMYVDSALIMSEKANDIYTQSLMFGVKGLIEIESKNYDAALPYLRQSLAAFNARGNNADAADLWNALGLVYFNKNMVDSSLYCYLIAERMGEAAGAQDVMRLAYEGLSNCYSARGDFKKAYDYLHKFLIVQNHYLDSLNIRKVTELNAKYEAVSKQRKIDLLEKDQEIQAAKAEREKTIRNFLIGGGLLLLLFLFIIYNRYKERKKLSEELSQSLSELKQTQKQLIETEKQKEQENVRLRISRDIHDEIGSNLTKIALLSDLLTADAGESGNETKQSLKKISTYARDVNTSLSEIVWSVNPKQDTLESLVAYMRNFVHSFLQDTGIHFTIDFPAEVDNMNLNPDYKRAIFLVLKETLNNCVKHSNAQNITVKLRTTGHHFELTIKDDGKGFNVHDKSLLGNGLSNLEDRIHQLHGNYVISSAPQNGCEVNISVDLV
ncbi:MAG TPA: sensor histidine kinase [Chitinophagales bacterium]|nr:sensor histidine kinase [Chitinophagales bacterium]